MMEKKIVIIVIITVISLLLLGSLLFFSSRFVGRAIYSEFAVGQAGFSVENNKFLKGGEIALPVYVNIAEEAIFFKFTVDYGVQLTFQEFVPNLVDFSGMVELNKINLNNQLIYAGAVLPDPDANVPFRKLNGLVKLGTLKFRAVDSVNLANGPVTINLPFTNFEVLGADESNLINSLVSASIMIVECLQDSDCGSGSCQNNRCAAAPTPSPAAPTQEICNNARDDDNDNLIDGVDPDCRGKFCTAGSEVWVWSSLFSNMVDVQQGKQNVVLQERIKCCEQGQCVYTISSGTYCYEEFITDPNAYNNYLLCEDGDWYKCQKGAGENLQGMVSLSGVYYCDIPERGNQWSGSWRRCDEGNNQLVKGNYKCSWDGWGLWEEICVDNDGDGRGNPVSSGCSYRELDCDDGDASIYPGAVESCDLKDNNCDGIVDGLGVCRDKNNCGAYGKACTNRNNICSGGECLCGMNEGCGGNLFCNPENEMGTCESCPQGESWNGEDCVLSCVGLNEVNALKSNIANVLAGKSLAEINQYLWDIFERYDMECGK